MGKKKIVTEKAQLSSTRDGGKTTRGERPSDRGALQRYGSPAEKANEEKEPASNAMKRTRNSGKQNDEKISG